MSSYHILWNEYNECCVCVVIIGHAKHFSCKHAHNNYYSGCYHLLLLFGLMLFFSACSLPVYCFFGDCNNELAHNELSQALHDILSRFLVFLWGYYGRNKNKASTIKNNASYTNNTKWYNMHSITAFLQSCIAEG